MPVYAVSCPPRFVEAKVSATGRMGTFIEAAVPIPHGSPLIVPLSVYMVQSSLPCSRKRNDLGSIVLILGLKLQGTDMLPSYHVQMALLLVIFAAFPR